MRKVSSRKCIGVRKLSDLVGETVIPKGVFCMVRDKLTCREHIQQHFEFPQHCSLYWGKDF